MNILALLLSVTEPPTDGHPFMEPTTIIGILGALGIGAVGAAIVTGLFSRRKLGADATKVITEAAAGVVATLEAAVSRAEKRAETAEARTEEIAKQSKGQLDAMATAHAKERQEWRRVLQLHVAWDGIAIAKVAELGVQLPPAPPLLPPSRFTDDNGYPNGGVD